MVRNATDFLVSGAGLAEKHALFNIEFSVAANQGYFCIARSSWNSCWISFQLPVDQKITCNWSGESDSYPPQSISKIVTQWRWKWEHFPPPLQTDWCRSSAFIHYLQTMNRSRRGVWCAILKLFIGQEPVSTRSQLHASRKRLQSHIIP